MKKIKDPALFEKIRKFLTEDMPVLRKKSPNTVEAYRYTLNIYLVFLCEKHSKSLYNITVKDFSQKNILFFLDWLIDTLNRENRVIFMRRYWYSDSYAAIAALTGLTEKNVSVRLARVRKQLRDYLMKQGVLT